MSLVVMFQPHVSFCSMFRPPRSSTLFPYTTLFRSQPHQRRGRVTTATACTPALGVSVTWSPVSWVVGTSAISRTVTLDERSEEHTSELQSRGHLVCRLLLDKKKLTIVKYTVVYISK